MTIRDITTIRDHLRYQRQYLSKTLPEIPGVAYIFISPFIILFGIFLAFPIVYTFYLSFFRFKGVGGEPLFWIDLGFSVSKRKPSRR